MNFTEYYGWRINTIKYNYTRKMKTNVMYNKILSGYQPCQVVKGEKKQHFENHLRVPGLGQVYIYDRIRSPATSLP
jgi:hypothetical protein